MTRRRVEARPPARDPIIRPFGDAALLVELGSTVDAAVAGRVHGLVRTLDAALEAGAGWGRPVAGIAGVLVPFDAARLLPSEARQSLEAVLARSDIEASGPDDGRPPFEIPVRYGGEDGPDLVDVASALGLEPAEVVRRHAQTAYRVLAIGFVPGFAYLGPLAATLRLPRRPEPRPRVPAGSVAIAADMTAVYPVDSPGGWHLIGRTKVTLWAPAADPPTPLEPGALVRFVPVAG
jgi:KipI family sensor histidine kinase inhibitor